MANRYAPYKARWLAREPKRVICKFTHSTNDEQLPNSFSTNTTYGNPFNQGVYSVKRTAAGIYQIHLGTQTGNDTDGHESTMKDAYSHLAGAKVTFTESKLQAYVSNDQASNTTTPFVEITCELSNDFTNTNVSAATYVELLFLDSKS